MGASASTNQQTIENKILNEAYNSCPSIGTTNIVNLSGIKFLPPNNCNPPPSFTIGQTATVNATCLLSSLQKANAEAASKLNSDSKAGLGISVSTNINDVVNSVTNITKNTCAGVSTTNRADISDTVIRACKFQVVQDATQNVSCQINSAQDLASKIAAEASSQAQGGSIFGNLFGDFSIWKIILIIVVVVIVGLIFVLYKFFTRKKKPSAMDIPIEELTRVKNVPAGEIDLTGGLMSLFGGKSINKYLATNKTLLIIFILLVLILIIVILNRYYQCRRYQHHS